jgi:hypothetical protein
MQIKTGVSSSLDSASRLRLQLFAFKLLIMVPVSAVFASHRSYPLLATMSLFFFWNGVFAAVPALFQHQKVKAAFLTAWDEMAAFFGLAALMGTFNAMIG